MEASGSGISGVVQDLSGQSGGWSYTTATGETLSTQPIGGSGNGGGGGGGGGGGSIAINGDTVLQEGSLQATGSHGGQVTVSSTGTLFSAAPVEVQGQSGGGGVIQLEAGLNLLQTASSLLQASGWSAGGSISVSADGDLFSSARYEALGWGDAARGGLIEITGSAVTLQGASADASGGGGGGTIHVGGGFQGLPLLSGKANATSTTINVATTLKADATRQGDGGEVVVWSDQNTSFLGKVSARGGALGGDGGRLEVSGLAKLSFRGSGDAGATAGQAGTLLLDPQDLLVVGDDNTDWTDRVAASSIYSALESGSDVSLDALGDVFILAPIQNNTDSTTIPNGGLAIAAGGGIRIDNAINAASLNLAARSGGVAINSNISTTEDISVTGDVVDQDAAIGEEATGVYIGRESQLHSTNGSIQLFGNASTNANDATTTGVHIKGGLVAGNGITIEGSANSIGNGGDATAFSTGVHTDGSNLSSSGGIKIEGAAAGHSTSIGTISLESHFDTNGAINISGTSISGDARIGTLLKQSRLTSVATGDGIEISGEAPFNGILTNIAIGIALTGSDEFTPEIDYDHWLNAITNEDNIFGNSPKPAHNDGNIIRASGTLMLAGQASLAKAWTSGIIIEKYRIASTSGLDISGQAGLSAENMKRPIDIKAEIGGYRLATHPDNNSESTLIISRIKDLSLYKIDDAEKHSLQTSASIKSNTTPLDIKLPSGSADNLWPNELGLAIYSSNIQASDAKIQGFIDELPTMNPHGIYNPIVDDYVTAPMVSAVHLANTTISAHGDIVLAGSTTQNVHFIGSNGIASESSPIISSNGNIIAAGIASPGESFNCGICIYGTHGEGTITAPNGSIVFIGVGGLANYGSRYNDIEPDSLVYLGLNQGTTLQMLSIASQKISVLGVSGSTPDGYGNTGAWIELSTIKTSTEDHSKIIGQGNGAYEWGMGLAVDSSRLELSGPVHLQGTVSDPNSNFNEGVSIYSSTIHSSWRSNQQPGITIGGAAVGVDGSTGFFALDARINANSPVFIRGKSMGTGSQNDGVYFAEGSISSPSVEIIGIAGEGSDQHGVFIGASTIAATTPTTPDSPPPGKIAIRGFNTSPDNADIFITSSIISGFRDFLFEGSTQFHSALINGGLLSGFYENGAHFGAAGVVAGDVALTTATPGMSPSSNANPNATSSGSLNPQVFNSLMTMPILAGSTVAAGFASVDATALVNPLPAATAIAAAQVQEVFSQGEEQARSSTEERLSLGSGSRSAGQVRRTSLSFPALQGFLRGVGDYFRNRHVVVDRLTLTTPAR